MPENTNKSRIQDILGRYCESIENFFADAFQAVDLAINGANVFVVFIARRCFVLACIFLRLLRPDAVSASFLKYIYSDGGMRVLAKQLAKEVYENKDYHCQIRLYDDILIHGRAIGSLLSNAEEIFADEYLQLCEDNSERDVFYTRDQLYERFLSFVEIKVGYANTQPNLLRLRYKKKLEVVHNNAEPHEWRDVSDRIANLIFNAEIPNAAFIPGILLNDKSSDNRESIQQKYQQLQKREGLLNCIYIRNKYREREMDSYIISVPSHEDIHSIFSVRCTDHYIIPFVFIPKLNEQMVKTITDKIISTLSERGFNEAEKIGEVLDRWRTHDKLANMCSELITMIFSLSLLRSFLKQIHFEESIASYYDVEAYLTKRTTVHMILCNYAHDPAVKHLMRFLMDPCVEPLFTIAQLGEMLSDKRYSDGQILQRAYNVTTQSLDYNDSKHLIGNLELLAFRYGIESEAEAYRLSTGSFTPSYEEVNYFSFPSDNDMESVVERLYNNDEDEEKDWMYKHASASDTFSYILQLMDYGSLALTTGTRFYDRQYMQCLKTGEQSINARAEYFAIALPFISAIERRCQRQNRQNISAFTDELNYFIHLDNSMSEDKLNSLDLDIEEFNNARQFVKDHVPAIIDFEESLYRSGQHSGDFRFALAKYMKSNYHADLSEQFDRLCSAYYDYLIY